MQQERAIKNLYNTNCGGALMASIHTLICKNCGRSFDISKRFTLSICPECKVSGATCGFCGQSIPYGKKFCSYSCNSKHNMSVSNPMSNPENRKKIAETKRERYGDQWEKAEAQRKKEKAEWDKGKAKRRKEGDIKRIKKIREEGTKIGLANAEGLRKARETTGNKLGLANPKIMKKARATCLEKYGVRNPAQAPAIRSVISEKVTIFRNDPAIKQKALDTLMTRYGVCNAYHVNNNFSSKAEDEIADFIASLGISFVRGNHSVLGNRELDIYCPDHSIAIEYNGMYWHSSEKKEANYHYDKTKRCAEKGIRLIHIYEWEWLDPVKKEILKSALSIAFGKLSTLIYARQCEIRPVSLPDYRAFCIMNHLQGYRAAKVVYGLYYKDELKQLMSFSPPQKRNAKETFQWEIVRGCPGSNNIVVGGVSRLWKHFLRRHNPDSVMSFCDMNKFEGTSYLAIGMSLYKTEPANAWYIDKDTGKVQQWLFRNKEKRERLLANSFIVYGAGNMTFVWRQSREN